MKRLFDIIFALLLLIITFKFLLLIGLSSFFLQKVLYCTGQNVLESIMSSF